MTDDGIKGHCGMEVLRMTESHVEACGLSRYFGSYKERFDSVICTEIGTKLHTLPNSQLVSVPNIF